MTITAGSGKGTSSSRYELPPTLRTTLAAMQLPEVQD